MAFAMVPHPVSGLPLPQLTVTAAAGLTVRVQRDGVTVGEVVSPGPNVKVVDLAAPAGSATWKLTTLSAVLYAERSQETTVTGLVAAEGGWMFDPTRPETAVLARVNVMDSMKVGLRSSVFEPIGQPFAIVQPGVPSASRSAMTVHHGDPAVIDRVLELLKSGAVLMLHGWPESGEVKSRQPDITFRPVGEVAVERLEQGPFGYRQCTFDFVSAPVVSAGLGTIT